MAGVAERSARWLLAGMMMVFMSGCATQKPYRYGVETESPLTYRLPEGEPQIVYGRPNAFLDASDWIWPGSWISKIILWDRRVDRHQISPETEEILVRYLEANGLSDVKVRFNSVNAPDELRRTVRNRAVAPGWRYTLGMIAWVQYMIMPGRFFGGDNFNPWSNTINLYSDIPAIALHEAGHAKDFASRRFKGTYAAIYMLPLVPLYHEAQASNDALSWLREEETLALQREGYRIMHPAYGTYVGGAFGDFIPPPYNMAAVAIGAAGGHITGRVRGATLPDPVAPSP